MGCQCQTSKNELLKEQTFKEEVNTNRSLNSKKKKNIIYLISENTLDSNLNKHFNSFQNSNCLTYQLFEVEKLVHHEYDRILLNQILLKLHYHNHLADD